MTTVIKANTTVYAKFEQKRVLYLQLNSAWKASNARYAAYVWTSGKEQWFDLSQEDGDVYRVELTAEATSWSNIIFVKMKPNTTGNNWDNKDAQTEDLKIQPQLANTDCFKITGNQSEGKAIGTWVKYPFDTFTVALDAVSYDSAGSKETNGFTGGKVSVGGVVHTSAVTNTYSDPTTVTATAVCNEGYQFAGWYSDSDCINKVAGNAELSISVNSSVHYYAKFVKSSTKVMYFVPNTNWTKNKNERFAAYVYEKSTGDGKWYSMTEDAAHTCYTFTMDASGKYDRIIFSRMNGSTTENSWDNEWNRTPGTHGGKVEGIAIPTDGTNCFVQATGNYGWDNCGGSWTTK